MSLIKEGWASISPLIKIGVGLVLLVLIVILLWYKGTQIWNGIGNWFFHKQINAERVKVDKDLKDAAEQKKVLEQTLRDLAEAKKQTEIAKAETDRLKGIFNNESTTAAQKVAEFRKSIGSEPIHTDTDSVTLSDLCQRAKDIHSSAATLAALCGN